MTQSPQTEAALACCLALIQDFAEFLDAIEPELASSLQEPLARVRSRLVFDPSPESLEEGRETVSNELAIFARRVRDQKQRQTDELGQVLLILAQAADAFAIGKDGYADQLRHFSHQLGQTEPKLRAQFEELRAFFDLVSQENQRILGQMERQMEDYRERLQIAESDAATDPLTALPNRRELDRQLAARIAAGREFCLLLLDLDSFKLINEKLGHLFGDRVLREIGAALASQVRARDFACRWGGDQFLVVLECGLARGEARAEHIAKWLEGAYRACVEASGQAIDVHVSVGVTNWLPGQTPADIFQRAADQLRQKRQALRTAPVE